MAQFMIEVAVPAEPNTEFISLIPAQRAHIEKLLEEGTVMGYSLSLDRSKLWITLVARNRREALELLRTFPLYEYFEPSIYPLMFHNSPVRSLLKVSLN